jgi:hypothetical protein
MVGQVTLGGKPLRGVNDPLETSILPVPLRLVESSIDAGFRAQWGEVDIDGDTLEICSGAGFGSAWATISFRGKHYAIGAHDIVQAFLDHLEPVEKAHVLEAAVLKLQWIAGGGEEPPEFTQSQARAILRQMGIEPEEVSDDGND